MHWSSRATLAIVTGCGFMAWYSGVFFNEVYLTIHAVLTGSRPVTFQGWPETMSAIISTLPILCVAFAVYGLLTRLFGPTVMESESRCRKCGYILRGIPEPRCPECGERI